ncbi:hypothetical protein CKM354_000773000 [Cercospora kikuchii]|uniref:Uncharacterized protein n=1 Tax=Cercospora kikuchii TaxID=84275 RepID=A0A9P3FJ06_9PEZI|nr:uncharacterized protein CKM354_000773000 [Cercospora kikuchii]GIZ44534.1 hypothetical protein CKM354_000773000 [Cercospora kikuchii]
MAPNPIMIPRKPVRKSIYEEPVRDDAPAPGISYPILATVVVMFLLSAAAWPWKWTFSGAGIETLLLLYGHSQQKRVLPVVPLWTLLATLNLAYAVCSTSWLLHGLFVTTIYPFVLLTCLNQFPWAANIARSGLRKALGGQSHFVKDKLAMFNLPALEIDTDVDGLFVIRGITVSFSNLSLVAHGIELGLKLADDIELAIYVDEVVVNFFRHIAIGDVYANAKGGKFEMTFGELEEEDSDDAASEFSVLLDDTPLLKAAAAKAKVMSDRPKLRETLTGVSYMRDSSVQQAADTIKTLDPDDEAADQQYHDILTEIRTSSAVYQSRQQVRQNAKSNGRKLEDEKDMRAAVCAALQEIPSVPHPPRRSIRVTTLQNSSPPYVRRFLHRLPFLLRLLLTPLSYLHPVSIASINAAGSGKWLSSLLQQQVFKQYTENNSQLRKLQRKVSTWTADANFCVQLTDIDGLGQVPLNSNYNIVTYLKFDDVLAYRTIPASGVVTQVMRLGGADATFTIPTYLLPHHEHILPRVPDQEDEHELEVQITEADGMPKAVQAAQHLKQVKKDETNIKLSVHGSLPVSCDQSLLNFIAALVKATKIIELEKTVEEEVQPPDTPMSSTPTGDEEPGLDAASPDAKSETNISLKEVAGFKVFAKNLRQNLRDGTTKAQIKDIAKDWHQTAKDGMKKAAVTGLVNDRWIAHVVGKVASTLQKAQGDLGWSGNIPIPLGPYRDTEDAALTKILP